jgi:hypothetical protein
MTLLLQNILGWEIYKQEQFTTQSYGGWEV